MSKIIRIFKGGCMSSSVYLVELVNPQKIIIVDVSTKQYTKEILKGITSNGFKYSDISLIIITHTHWDHVEGLSNLKKHLINAEVLVHKSESNNLKNGNFKLKHQLWIITFVATIIVWILKTVFNYLSYKGCSADILIGDKYEIREGCFVLYTPGHSVGSISLIVGKNAIVGDTIYNKWGYPKIPLFYYDFDLVKKQWKKLIDYGCTKFYPGHGKIISNKVITF